MGSIDLVAAEAIYEWASSDGTGGYKYDRGVCWVIIGAESGHNARPCAFDWIRSIINQCRAAAIPVYVKQLGTFWAKESGSYHLDNKASNPEAWLPDLRIREFPVTQGSHSRSSPLQPSTSLQD